MLNHWSVEVDKNYFNSTIWNKYMPIVYKQMGFFMEKNRKAETAIELIRALTL